MKLVLSGVSGALALMVSLSVHAQSSPFPKMEDAIKYRQSAFTIMNNHMGRLGAMAQGRVPFDAAKAQESARIVENMSKLPWEAFPVGSNVAPSKVKGDPWKDAPQFRQAQDKLMAETGKLVPAAASLDTLRTQIGAVGASCKACHDSFRQ